ncbi:hypothetical protein D9M71_642410 [compost metagenome]
MPIYRWELASTSLRVTDMATQAKAAASRLSTGSSRRLAPLGRQRLAPCRTAPSSAQTTNAAVCTGSQCHSWPKVKSSMAQAMPAPMPAVSTSQARRL